MATQFKGFGNGHDGAVSSATGTINTYAACTGTAGQSVLTTTLAASAGDMVLVHQSRGTANVGKWEIVIVTSDAGATLNLATPLVNTYAAVSQAVLIPQYTAGTCGNALTGTAWNETTGGIIALAVNGALTLSGSATLNASGYLGAAAVANLTNGKQGEGTVAARGGDSYVANGNGGGGGDFIDGVGVPGGGGGGNGAAGTGAADVSTANGGDGGGTVGNVGLTLLNFGGGGGSGAMGNETTGGGAGGKGGGIVLIIAKQFTLSGTIPTTGGNGGNGSGTNNCGGGGGGAGGSILIKAQTAVLGTNLATAIAGTGGTKVGGQGSNGGSGGAGRIHLDYLSSYTGTTNPTLNASVDKTLASPSFMPFL